MSKYPTALASALENVEFTRLSAEEIEKISVKRIHVTPTLDSLGGPAPGGLYDPALGAIRVLDTTCSTCQMNSHFCAGHPGHIELPIPCYHISYIDQALRLLRSQCVYCHRLRMPRRLIEDTSCKLSLLQYGLLNELREFENIKLKEKRKSSKLVNGDTEEALPNGISDTESDEDLEAFSARKQKFVKKNITRACKRDPDERLVMLRNPAAAVERQAIVKEFVRDMAALKKCAHCQGISPGFRKDRNSKIFQKALNKATRDKMKQIGLVAAKPLLILQEEAKQGQERVKLLVNGYHKEDIQMTDAASDVDNQLHGAEEEIAISNALSAGPDEHQEAELDEEASQIYLSPSEVHAALKLLFRKEQKILTLLYTSRPIQSKDMSVNPEMFFIKRILVPPNKYRPVSKTGEIISEAAQNSIFNRIIKAINNIEQITHEMRHPDADPASRNRGLREWRNAVVVLQEAVNSVTDHAPNARLGAKNERGVKQVLEKKEGLFRTNMMGKRVNFAARSVISPDPNIETNEIGVPMVFAKKLTYTEPVTSHNFFEMKKAVINGPFKYPGAAAVEDENGLVTSLKFKNLEQRIAIANQLLTPTVPGFKGGRNKKVDRHLQSGDVVLMNRQPTLHKPSMMGHRARVLPGEKTIRMHYANCNTYNADFDGDEMNMHFPQNEVARSEALQIADTDHQYLSATAGKPLRGLIQDHISIGVQFTKRDTFFDRDGYQQLLYSCIRPEDASSGTARITLMHPAILKPKPLWTGKQVISTVLKNIKPENRPGLNLRAKCSTSADHWAEKPDNDSANFKVTGELNTFQDTEQIVIFKDGEYLCGILDKSHLGPTAGGLVHSVHELYGHRTAGKLLSVLGRLLTRFLSENAWSCGLEDLYLTKKGDSIRSEILSEAPKIGQEVAVIYVSLHVEEAEKNEAKLVSSLESVLRSTEQQAGLDQAYNAQTSQLTGSVTKANLPAGLRKPFPRNQMQAMTISGAKGSNVNASLISCNLGQQVLEGRRVPTMVSGKTLPAYRAYETDPAAGGYISGRFLTGINPKEYFFHAMSGREGLIDTAVKTATSGYLQRCIVKGLEAAKTEYDTSVRETSSGSMIQFLYGEDGLDVPKQKTLTDFTFLAQNNDSIKAAVNLPEYSRFADHGLSDMQKGILRSVKRGHAAKIDPIISVFPPASNLGSTSESFAQALETYIKENPDQLIKQKTMGIEGVISKATFRVMMHMKYIKSLVEAGEAIGVVAAQSIGEPSTQMTLNTFHLAGHSAKNVTLGIPRLREILMTASKFPSTPVMTIKPIPELSRDHGIRFAKSISRLSLADLIKNLQVQELSGEGDSRTRFFNITVDFWPAHEYEEEHVISTADVDKTLKNKFIARLEKLIGTEMKKKAKEASLSETTAAVPQIGATVGREKSPPRERAESAGHEGGEDDEDDGEDDEDIDPDDAKQTATRDRQETVYDEPDDDEKAADAESSEDEPAGDSDTESTSSQQAPRKKHTDKAAQNLREQDPDDAGSDEEDSSNESDSGLLAEYVHLKRFKFDPHKSQCRIQLSYDISTPKIVLLPIVEKAARLSVIQQIPGIGDCILSTEKVHDRRTGLVQLHPNTGGELTENIITTAGVNLLALRDYQDIIDPHTIATNSIHAMAELYGIEAARATIVREIDGVFKSHGISVDLRHLLLIGDAMTQSGTYKGFNRNGVVRDTGSLLAKMSFETVMGVLKDAVLFGEGDNLMGPSARIVAGMRGKVGTGSFDVVVPVGGQVS